MIIEIGTYIEVENEPFIWAIELDECKGKMKPIKPEFVSVHNDLSNKNAIYIDNTLLKDKPEKIIEGITGGIVDTYIEVGFWRLKHKNL